MGYGEERRRYFMKERGGAPHTLRGPRKSAIDTKGVHGGAPYTIRGYREERHRHYRVGGGLEGVWEERHRY